MSRLNDCVFQHSTTATSLDVYRIQAYPAVTKRCSRHHHHHHRVTTSSPLNRSTTDEYCEKPWYLGVSKGGKVRVVKLHPTESPTRRTHFLQEWVHKRVYNNLSLPRQQPNQWSATTRPDGGDAERRFKMNRAVGEVRGDLKGSVFAILGRRRNVTSAIEGDEHGEVLERVEDSSVNCSNLLSRNCAEDDLGLHTNLHSVNRRRSLNDETDQSGRTNISTL